MRYVVFSRSHWTVPQLSIMIIYNCTWSILIQSIRIILSSDNLIQKIQKKAYFQFVINLITRSKKICRMGRSLKNCGTIHCQLLIVKWINFVIIAYLEVHSMLRGSFIKFQDWGCNAYIFSHTFLIFTIYICITCFK